MPSVQRSASKNWPTIPAAHELNSQTELTIKQETCWTLHGNLWKSRRSNCQKPSRARREASAQKVRGYYKQFAEAKHLEYKSSIDNEVFDLVDLRKFKPKNYVRGRWVLTIKIDKQGNILRARWRTERIPAETKGSTCTADRFSCFYQTWISDELPYGSQQKLGSFPHWSQNTLFFKDSLMMWIVMLCADCHQKQVIHHTLLQDWRNLRKVGMMHLDVGGTFLTRHYALMVWFPHELIDAATYGIRYSRVSKLGNTGDKGPSHSRTIQKTPSLNHVSNQKWGLHLKKRWIPKLEVQLQENQWQESSIYCGWSLWNRRNQNGRTSWEQTWKRFPSWFRRLERCCLDRTKNSLDTRFPKRAYIEINQNEAIEELEEIRVERNTKKASTALLQCTRSAEALQISNAVTNYPDVLRWQSPTIGDVRSLNKLARQIKSQPVKLQYWPLTGNWEYFDFLMPLT